MNGWNDLIKKIWLLVLDIFQLTVRLGREIVLPGKKEKGNLLSTFFLFFIALVEKLHGFEHGAFKMNAFFKNRYIKTGFVLITGLLFFLTSYEYSGTPVKSKEEVSWLEKRTEDIVSIQTTERFSEKLIQRKPVCFERAGFTFPVPLYRNLLCFCAEKVYLKNRTLLI